MRNRGLCFVCFALFAGFFVVFDSAESSGEQGVKGYTKFTLGPETYLIPKDNHAEGNTLLNELFGSQEEPDEEILIKFDRDALQDYFGTDFGSEKLFVVKVGDSFKRSKEEAIKRAHKVLFDGPRYKNRVIEFIPEIDAYRIFRNSSVRMFWDLSIVNPLEVKKENVNENSLMSYCQIWFMALKRRSCLIDR